MSGGRGVVAIDGETRDLNRLQSLNRGLGEPVVQFVRRIGHPPDRDLGPVDLWHARVCRPQSVQEKTLVTLVGAEAWWTRPTTGPPRRARESTLSGHSRGMHNIPLRAAQAMFRRANPQPLFKGYSHPVTKSLQVERDCVDPSAGLCRRDPCGTAGLHTAVGGPQSPWPPEGFQGRTCNPPAHLTPVAGGAVPHLRSCAPRLGHEVIPGVAGKQGTLSNGEARRDRTAS